MAFQHKPVRWMDFKYCLGMIWSVSILERSNGTTKPVSWTNCCIMRPLQPLSDINEMTRNSGRSSHCRTDKMRPPAGALTAFEITVRRMKDANEIVASKLSSKTDLPVIWPFSWKCLRQIINKRPYLWLGEFARRINHINPLGFLGEFWHNIYHTTLSQGRGV